MSDVVHIFDAPRGRTMLLLPFALDDAISAWTRLQRAMTRSHPDAFTRDEWAYLISFLDEANLRAPFVAAFGESSSGGAVQRIARPRGEIAVWLPNNVSLLGPLTLILLSLTGNRVRVKAGSRADDLATAFVTWASNADAGAAAILERTRIEQFDRSDPRNAAMAAAASIRIAFGSDASASAIEALPHPIHSRGIYFSDRTSEAWLDLHRADDETLRTMAKVFAIYGTAGCTSPRRLVVLDGTIDDALRIRERLAEVWPSVVTRDVPMHHASQNIAAAQVAAATGWEATTTPRNAAAIAAGTPQLPAPPGFLALPVVAATLGEALASLPANIQTLGQAIDRERLNDLLPRLASAGVKRIVPIGSMHHFGALWDGWNYWQETFEEIEVQS